MSYKATITDTDMKPYTACVDILDENGNFVDGYMVTGLEDKRQIKAPKGTDPGIKAFSHGH